MKASGQSLATMTTIVLHMLPRNRSLRHSAPSFNYNITFRLEANHYKRLHTIIDSDPSIFVTTTQ